MWSLPLLTKNNSRSHVLPGSFARDGISRSPPEHLVLCRVRNFPPLHLTRGALVFICFALLVPPPAQGIPPEEMDETFLHFRYQGVVEALVPGLYDGDRAYLPLFNLFERLQIHHSFDLEENVVEGFFLQETNLYSIDLAAGEARIGERTIFFSNADFATNDLEIYLAEGLFSEIFGLHFSINWRRLTLGLTTSDTLPVVLERERARRRDWTAVPHSLQEEAPLLFERDRRLLGGGFFDYSWTSRHHEGDPSHNYHIFGGAELLGGDVQGSIHGGTAGKALDSSTENLRWRYVFDPNPILTQFLAGGLLSTGLQAQSYRGIRVSNEPIEPRELLGFYRLQGQTQPGWEVELYMNNSLLSAVEAGPTGEYAFDIPLGYGTQQTSLRFYGPTGEFEEVERRFSVPFRFIPPGEIDYNIAAGRTTRAGRDLVQASIARGMTDRLTAGIGIDYTETFPGETAPRHVPYHTLSYRFADGYIGSFENAPEALQRLSLNAFYANQSSWEAQLIRYRQHPLYGPIDARGEARGSLFVPFSFAELPLGFRFHGRAVDYLARPTEVYYNPEIDVRYRQGLYSLGAEEYRGARSETFLVGGLRYSVSQPDFLRNLIWRVLYRYNLRQAASDEIQVDASRRLTRNGRIRVGWRHRFPQRNHQAELSFTYDFPATRSTTTYRRVGRSDSAIQTFRGSVAYDPENNRLFGYSRPMVGSGGVAFRPFVDFDGTGTYDEGDEIIQDRLVRFREPVSTRQDPDGLFRAYNLMPYSRYSVEIDVDRIRNPLWAPRTESFSFITDPNRFKQIDVPFFVSGVIDGTVLRTHNGLTGPVGGLRLLLRQVDGDYEVRIPVFSDGSFYQMGIPPGNYEIQVDPIHLERLKMLSTPSMRSLKILATRDGDFVGGVDFTLRSPD